MPWISTTGCTLTLWLVLQPLAALPAGPGPQAKEIMAREGSPRVEPGAPAAGFQAVAIRPEEAEPPGAAARLESGLAGRSDVLLLLRFRR